MSAPQKTIEVEPTDEGPKVHAKRQMTEAQLAALKRGREKLAEKRKQQITNDGPILELAFGPKVELSIGSTAAPVTEPPTEPVAEPAAETPDEGNGGNDIEHDYHPLCVIM
jgi:hypothetical protein